MDYIVRIKIPNKMFTIKNLPVRSPVQCTVNENELKLIRSRISFYGLTDQKDYVIEEIKTEKQIIDQETKKKDYASLEAKIPEKTKIIKPPDIIPTFKSKNVVTKPTLPPIQKTYKKEEKTFFQKPIIEQQPKTEVTQIQKNRTDVPENIEQNIKKCDQSSTEVKIEELSSKATTILDKFLHSEF